MTLYHEWDYRNPYSWNGGYPEESHIAMSMFIEALQDDFRLIRKHCICGAEEPNNTTEKIGEQEIKNYFYHFCL